MSWTDTLRPNQEQNSHVLMLNRSKKTKSPHKWGIFLVVIIVFDQKQQQVITKQYWQKSLHIYCFLLGISWTEYILIGCDLVCFTLIGRDWDDTDVLVLLGWGEGLAFSRCHFSLPLHPLIIPCLSSFQKLDSS